MTSGPGLVGISCVQFSWPSTSVSVVLDHESIQSLSHVYSELHPWALIYLFCCFFCLLTFPYKNTWPSQYWHLFTSSSWAWSLPIVHIPIISVTLISTSVISISIAISPSMRRFILSPSISYIVPVISKGVASSYVLIILEITSGSNIIPSVSPIKNT